MYYIYKITCTLDGEYKNMEYIGKRKYPNPHNDGYMGGGQLLEYFKILLGIENFKKEILFIFDNDQENSQMEKKLVNKDYIARKDTFNYSLGGRCSRLTKFACNWKHELKQYIVDVDHAERAGIEERNPEKLRAIIQAKKDRTYHEYVI